MNLISGPFHLWVLLAPLFLAVVTIMGAATRLRGAQILNREDHRPANIAAFAVNFAVFFAVTALTPLRVGPWFWMGAIMLVPAALLYLLSIAAFTTKTKRTGLATGGVYARTRNPMYVALSLLVLAFSLMAVQASAAAALALLTSSGVFFALIRARVAHEERYLETAYGDAWRAYRDATARFLDPRSFR